MSRAPNQPAAGAASWALPAAIVVGCALVGLGVFFGLRRPAPADTNASPSPVATRSVPASASTVTTGVRPDSAAGDPELPLRAAEQARVALEKHRPLMLEKCFRPLTADGGPKQALFDFVYGFDAAGRQTKREVRAAAGQPAHPELARCLEGLAGTDIALPATSAMPVVRIQVPFP